MAPQFFSLRETLRSDNWHGCLSVAIAIAHITYSAISVSSVEEASRRKVGNATLLFTKHGIRQRKTHADPSPTQFFCSRGPLRSTILGSPRITLNFVSSPSRQKLISSLCLPTRRSNTVRSGSHGGSSGSM